MSVDALVTLLEAFFLILKHGI